LPIQISRNAYSFRIRGQRKIESSAENYGIRLMDQLADHRMKDFSFHQKRGRI
jgi:hypothetical protein